MPRHSWRSPSIRLLRGAGVTVLGIAVAVVALVPARSSITVDTAALVLVVPVAIGVAIGGFAIAPFGVVSGFVAFDVFFIPPYGTFRVGAGEHWVSLAVYTAVGLIVGGVVAQVQSARVVAQRRESEIRMLYELAEAVAGADGLDAALHAVAGLARQLFHLSTVEVLLAEPGGGLRVAASEGPPFPKRDVQRLGHALRLTEPRSISGAAPGLLAVALPTASGPAGFLAVAANEATEEDLKLLSLFATQAGAAVERARLADETTRGRTLAEVDRLRSALIGAVSHDLRTPLGSIKAAVSDLSDPSVRLSGDDRRVLLSTIEEETDRLTRFVSNLLDMSRIESGGLQLRRSATPVDELIEQLLVRFAKPITGPVTVRIPDDLPLVDIDYLLVEQVMANLLENVVRHCPSGTAIEIEALVVGRWVELRVSDDGPGIPAAERQRIFELFQRVGAAVTSTGMGLAICKGIVEAHGGQIWVEQRQGLGSTFVFRLPPSTAPAALNDDDLDTAAARHGDQEASGTTEVLQ